MQYILTYMGILFHKYMHGFSQLFISIALYNIILIALWLRDIYDRVI